MWIHRWSMKMSGNEPMLGNYCPDFQSPAAGGVSRIIVMRAECLSCQYPSPMSLIRWLLGSDQGLILELNEVGPAFQPPPQWAGVLAGKHIFCSFHIRQMASLILLFYPQSVCGCAPLLCAPVSVLTLSILSSFSLISTCNFRCSNSIRTVRIAWE